jgi:hypothetical protein
MHHLDHLWRTMLQYGDRLGPQGWLLVLAAMIAVAVVCMRGFGSRSEY